MAWLASPLLRVPQSKPIARLRMCASLPAPRKGILRPIAPCARRRSVFGAMCAESGLCAVIKHILGRAMFYATEIEGRGNMLRPSKGQYEWMHVLLPKKKWFYVMSLLRCTASNTYNSYRPMNEKDACWTDWTPHYLPNTQILHKYLALL
jgi:hypothetical protein